MIGNDKNQGKFIQINGIKMYYEDHGTGHPLVLLHGGGGTGSANWAEYLLALSQDFRVITPDCRGHGRTNNPSGELSYARMADDIAVFIKEIELDKPFICGWSDGGQIVLELAMRYPGLASAYIAGAVWKDFTDFYIQSLRGLGMEKPGKVNIDQLQKAMPEYAELLKNIHSPQGEEYWKELLKEISRMWLTPLNYTKEDFLKMEEPILIVIGDRDQFIPLENEVAIFRFIPHAELAVIPGADHNLSLTNAKEFSEIILEYLKRHTT